MRRIVLPFLVSLLLAACGNDDVPDGDPWARAREAFPRPQHEWTLPIYCCQRARTPIEIDGRSDEVAWEKATWTEDFVDIEGGRKARPRLDTRVKMLWDDRHLYVLAEMQEPHLQASFRKRDSYIFHEDNDFEVFLDPDGDTHDYFELEINAFGTEWDLFLDKPYRDGGEADDDFDLVGLRSAVHLDGTINDPSDLDQGWTLEIAIPFLALGERAGVPLPPEPGTQWRVNFSRVQWLFVPAESRGYVKKKDRRTGESPPEDNWVWSPQGLINVHYPERWGALTFWSDDRDDLVRPKPSQGRSIMDHTMALRLRRVYYLQKGWRELHGRWFTMDDRPPRFPLRTTLTVSGDRFLVIQEDQVRGGFGVLREDGWVGWIEYPELEDGR